MRKLLMLLLSKVYPINSMYIVYTSQPDETDIWFQKNFPETVRDRR